MDNKPIQLERIEEMPDFQPSEKGQPGVERVKLDERTQSIVNAFSVVDQQIKWLGKVSLMISRNLSLVMDQAQDARREAQTAVQAAKDVSEKIEANETKPYKTFTKLAEKLFWLAAGGAAVAVFERWLGVK